MWKRNKMSFFILVFVRKKKLQITFWKVKFHEETS